MPAQKPRETVEDLFGLVITELDRSVVLPNILNYTPWGDQLPFHQSDVFGRILTAGNRAGKTDALVVEFILLATNDSRFKHRPKEWGIGPVQLRMVTIDVVKGVENILLPKFKRWMTRSMLVDGSWDRSWDSRTLTLTFSNGSVVDFLTWGMGMEKFAGVARHAIGFDEEPPRDIFNECMMRLKDYNGIWALAGTPDKGMDWIYDLLVEPALSGAEDRVKVFSLKAAENPYLLTDDNSKYTIAMDKEEIEIREEGKYVARGGLVFPNFSVETHCVEHHDPSRHCQFYTSVDVGWNNPTAWLWHAVSPNGDIYTYAEHYASNMTVREHAAVVKARETAMRHFLKGDVYRTGDPAMKQTSHQTGVNTIQSYAAEGLYIGVEGIPHEVQIGIEKMQQYFLLRKDGTPTWTISMNCVNLIRELKKLRWETYESQKATYAKNKQETVHKKDDHAFDSARYFATMMPDLGPDKTIAKGEKPTTISYQEMMTRLSNDSTVVFEDTRQDWDVSYANEGEYDNA